MTEINVERTNVNEESNELQEDYGIESQRSAYDQPIEYHLKNLQGHLRRTMASRHFTELKLNRDNKDQRQNIHTSNQRKLLKYLDKKGKFDYFRDYAVIKLEKDIINIIAIICENYKCEETENIEIPNRLFHWTREGFMERRKIENIIWVEVLRKEISPSCLEVQKLQIDFEDLLHFVKLIFKGIKKNDANFDVLSLVDAIHDSADYVFMFNHLKNELNENTKHFKLDHHRHIAMILTKNDKRHRDRLWAVEEKLMNFDVWNPIEVRYQLEYCHSIVNQNEDQANEYIHKYQKDIEENMKLSSTERYCSQCVMNTYYAEIEKYKSRIAELKAKYDYECDIMDNKLMYISSSIDKLRDQFRYYRSEIVRFHEEIERRHLKDLLEKEKEELERQKMAEKMLQSQLRLAAKKATKSKKKKSKA